MLNTTRKDYRNREENAAKTVRVKVTEPVWDFLRAHLHQPDSLERVAFMILGRAETKTHVNYVLHRFMPVPDDRCTIQQSALVEPDVLSVLDAFTVFKKSEAAAFMHVHSHPFSKHAMFSGPDNHYLTGEIASLRNCLDASNCNRDFIFLRLVTGQEEGGFTCEAYDAQGQFKERISEIRIIGRDGIRDLSCTTCRESAFSSPTERQDVLTDEDHKRLDRNLNWLGESGQRRITGTQLAICGLGGLGMEVLKNCRGLGFKKYTLIDMDRVEHSNLNRLSCGTADIGRLKVEVAKKFILDAIPDAEIHVISTPVEDATAQAALEAADFIVNALDDDGARLNVQVLAARHLIPLLDLGAGIHLGAGSRTVAAMGGQCILYVPGSRPCLVCQGLAPEKIVSRETRALHRQIGYVEGTDETPVSVITVNSVMGGIASDLLMKYISGFSSVPEYLTYDLLNHRALPIRFQKREECHICGTNGIEGLGAETVKPLVPACGAIGDEMPDVGTLFSEPSATKEEEGHGHEESHPEIGRAENPQGREDAASLVVTHALAAYAQHAKREPVLREATEPQDGLRSSEELSGGLGSLLS